MTDPQVRSALVITASDGAAAGVREDTSGAGVGERLAALGFRVDRGLVADDRRAIEVAIVDGAGVSRPRHHDRRHRPDARGT